MQYHPGQPDSRRDLILMRLENGVHRHRFVVKKMVGGHGVVPPARSGGGRTPGGLPHRFEHPVQAPLQAFAAQNDAGKFGFDPGTHSKGSSEQRAHRKWRAKG
jgi:hypothetical protein